MEIEVKYGNLKGGDFVGKLALEAKYSNATLGNLKDAVLDIAYAGDVEIGNAEKLMVDARYSGLKAQIVNRLQLESKYSNFKIEEVVDAEIEAKYGDGNINRLKNSLKMEEFDYSNLKVKALDKAFKEVRISARYGNVKLDIPASASFKVDADGLKYGSCKLSGFNISENEIGNDTHRCTVNGGKQGFIRFNGNGYSNLKVNSL